MGLLPRSQDLAALSLLVRTFLISSYNVKHSCPEIVSSQMLNRNEYMCDVWFMAWLMVNKRSRHKNMPWVVLSLTYIAS